MIRYLEICLSVGLLLGSLAGAFVPTTSMPFHHPEVLMSSTLQPTQEFVPRVGDQPMKGAIAMSMDELAEHLGGRGRAQLAWDCYSIGIDPALFWGDIVQLGYDDFETIYDAMPTSRRGQTLGKEALRKLAELYPNGGRLEGGVASLSHVSSSIDGTTKLLLRLQDGLEIETVIIPWNGGRSTLCISSQVGCRQGTYVDRGCAVLLVRYIVKHP